MLHEIVRDTIRISSCFFDFRVVSRTLSKSKKSLDSIPLKRHLLKGRKKKENVRLPIKKNKSFVFLAKSMYIFVFIFVYFFSAKKPKLV